MSVTLRRRLSGLEKKSAARQAFRTITCIPFSTYSAEFIASEVSPGVYLAGDRIRGRLHSRTVHYSDIELLRAWLSMADQVDCQHCIYTIARS